MPTIYPERIRLFAVRAEPDHGPSSSLGPMPIRNGLLIEVTTREGAIGWGEVWCNFPPRGNESRLQLFADVVAAEIIGRRFPNYRDARCHLERHFLRMAIHTGDAGSFRQCFAGLDTALADVAARLNGQPLCDHLGGSAAGSVQVYASTPNLARLEQSIGLLKACGHSAFKLKLGFGSAQDLKSLEHFRKLEPDAELMVDANQKWSPAEAQDIIGSIKHYDISFVEEPLLMTALARDWLELSAKSGVRLAAGENICSLEMFDEFLGRRGLGVAQPDVAKWGGISGAMDVANLVRKTGAAGALHFMGTAVGLAASVHAMAAMGCIGPVELDANPNPLRTELGHLDLKVREGRIGIPDGVGIGFVPDPAQLKRLTFAEFVTS